MLKYATMRQPVCLELKDVQLHLTILIPNGLVGDALSYLRRSRDQQNQVQLMHHLLSGCQEMHKLTVLLTLPLSDVEEEQLNVFFKKSHNILQESQYTCRRRCSSSTSSAESTPTPLPTASA